MDSDAEAPKGGEAPKRDLDGRCGTCGWYFKLRTDEEGVGWGDCRLGCWPSPLKDTATCSSYKAVGKSFEGSLKRKKVAGAPRTYASKDPEPYVPKPIPSELGIDMDQDEFREVLREVLFDELGVRDVAIGDRWRGGKVIIEPGKEDTQSKEIPLDTFFRKIVMVRDKLRVLEQKVNASKNLSDDEKVAMQQYITGCYGSLTTFNALFRDKKDQFKGQKK